ncbi:MULTISPECIES: class I SAM-dependent methyltransferase [Enterococcus]|uniref:Methyltransferase type 11 domain-containing protein n=1 Tax=Enterococcus sulfureus ATCC 49903 TaxID=1140003 RepID=S0P668_9ENTE|nr:methyltransferase domain-containing protein [Enterococcus sulfureus]EOT47663.1 hypothetical protein OMY_01037 [Enterococcus sulfureus ATCC 49903]EOT83916.1 hypothetical protein I573_01641 [Enterococcus sulfureus ATCC 49903]
MLNQQTAQFWDEFASEYYAIQQETFTTITTDIAHYLEKIGVLPTQDFVDLAGGYGKYIPTILPYVGKYYLVDFSKEMLQLAETLYPKPNIERILTTQTEFFTYSATNQYDCVFSALNPAMRQIEEVIQALRISERYACFVELVSDTEELFTEIEPITQTKEAQLFLTNVTRFATDQGIPWHKKRFTYTTQTMIEKTFALDYFAEDIQQDPTVLAKIESFYQGKESREVCHEVQFELVVLVK